MTNLTHPPQPADPAAPASPASQTTPNGPGLLRRIVCFPLTLLVIEFVVLVSAIVAIARGYELFDFPSNTPGKAFGAVLAAAGTIFAYKALKRWVERVPDSDFAWAGALKETGTGLLLGGAIFSIATAAVALMGGFEVLGVRGAGQIWTMLAIAIVSSVTEETIFRGVFLRHFESLIGTWGALALTSALFGAGHIFNPDSSWFAALAIAVEAGIMLGAAYLLTRRLWLAIGIHAGWNFAQGWLFSIPVSGGDAPLGLLITRRVGPEWLTGGDFGLEASVVALVVATTAGLLMLIRAVRRDGTVPPMWARNAASKD